ncbi:FAD/NAD(P)-binding oxidoreductase [Paraburkholderia sp. MM5384-R2]|uniref:NAD(P)/FAD-dependent oxidoreductase n=1 Tax=Paraburkholderia sp. MM5384-R2 TaxID=2723097 RepID=UPI0017A5557E|nr:FAD/NAD(P)-binding oxidoreductase [Paraburkholderia sp. MM5384-R2]MBB5499389.1 sulfide:quinone oxidoreductase [Paraburkholderia sp. MM5384-R2]
MIYEVAGEGSPRAAGGLQSSPVVGRRHSVVIVGGGAAGIGVASSLLSRMPDLDISIIEPADVHYYQPGWTMVGGGVFDQAVTVRTMASVMPDRVQWIKAAVTGFEPEWNFVVTDAGNVGYDHLVVCPGLKLDWAAIDGLEEALGKGGVTSNYRFDLAPYTWALVQELSARGGKAVFTQPPMPIKCAGAPQKAMYLSADYWQRRGMLRKVEIEFCNAGAVLFGVADYVPALMEYVEKYGVSLNFGENLVSVDGKARTATFKRATPDGSSELVTRKYDMLHVVPPQKAPDFVSRSKLADAAGWVEVDPATLQHKRFENIHALGDVGGMSNAKTVAAARKQVPVVAQNVLTALTRSHGTAVYDGYGSCPLTVERGKIVLAEFAYGGKVTPTFPTWLINGKRPSRLSWMLKTRLLPFVYWHGMLKGREWLVAPEIKR